MKQVQLKKPKNLLNYLMLFLSAIVLSFYFASCEKDDKDDKDPIAEVETTLEGTWRIIEEKKFGNYDSEMKWKVFEYPDQYGNQPYIRFSGGFLYHYFWDGPGENMHLNSEDSGPYSVKEDTLTAQIRISENLEEVRTIYEINGNQLTITFIDFDDLMEYIIAVKVPSSTVDDHLEPNGEESCEDDHLSTSILGSLWNPIKIQLNQIVDTIMPAIGVGQMGIRYFLEVESGKEYEIEIYDVYSDYQDVIDIFKYIEVSVAFETYPDDPDFEHRIYEEDPNFYNFDITSSSECFYIMFFSYQEDVEFKFKISKKNR